MVGPADVVGGRYRIERELAHGANGRLFEGRDEIEEERVLVVAPRDAATSDRFERDMRAVAALTHPAVARVIERGSDGGSPFAIVEMGDAIPLELILERTRIEARRSLRIVVQVLQALDHAHAAGLTHGAVAPATVLVTEGDRARLAGFGLVAKGDPRDDVKATGRLLDAMLPPERLNALQTLIARAVGEMSPFGSAIEMRRALEDVRVRIAPDVDPYVDEEEEHTSTIWPIPDARYDPTRLGRRVIAAMVAVTLIAGGAFLWRVLTRAEDLRERRENTPTPSLTTSAETLVLA